MSPTKSTKHPDEPSKGAGIGAAREIVVRKGDRLSATGRIPSDAPGEPTS
jgi:hypothetical protein